MIWGPIRREFESTMPEKMDQDLPDPVRALTAPPCDRSAVDFESVLGEYLECVEAGGAVSPEAYLEKYPQFAEELREFFVNEGWLRDLHTPQPFFAEPIDRWIGREVGRYRITEVIGCGGMGIVYRAEDELLSRSVAIKLLASGSLASQEEIRRIRSEAAAVARLDHPHIVPIFEVGTEDGHPYLVMPLLPQDDLQKRLQHNPLEAQVAARLIYDITTAVVHAHERGVIHRDLKPANVLFSQDGRPLLADFGLAKGPRTDSLITVTGQVLGTPQYMSPEQATGNCANTPATDIYGLGAILYACLTRVPPHQGTTIAEVIRYVLEEEIIPPRNLNPTVPRELQAICIRCLQREPANRYGTASALLEDLQRYLKGEPTLAGRVGPLHAITRPLQRDSHHGVFQAWGPTLLGLGVIVFVAHLCMAFMHALDVRYLYAYYGPRMGMFACMLWLLVRVREGKFGPQSTTERPSGPFGPPTCFHSVQLTCCFGNGVYRLRRSFRCLRSFPVLGSLRPGDKRGEAVI